MAARRRALLPTLTEIKKALRKAREHAGADASKRDALRLAFIVSPRTGYRAAQELGPLDRVSTFAADEDTWEVVNIPTRDRAFDVDAEAKLVRYSLASSLRALGVRGVALPRTAQSARGASTRVGTVVFGPDDAMDLAKHLVARGDWQAKVTPRVRRHIERNGVPKSESAARAREIVHAAFEWYDAPKRAAAAAQLDEDRRTFRRYVDKGPRRANRVRRSASRRMR